MAGATARPFTQALEQLWTAGTCAGLSDGQLLARFLAGRDEAGELAFEVLVRRHGAMVERVCHQVLDDPCDIHNAWQAVFLVLARRADAIRNRESVGGWLHGVALRVAKRTRAMAIRHRMRDRRTNEAALAQAIEVDKARHGSSCGIEREERAEAVHHEISRLPEKFRAPIVLCYMEGLTHDEAAACLSWPVGTVRSRLSRGRDKLRRRLSGRGLAAPAAVGPLGAWLAGGESGAAGAAAAIPPGVAQLVVKLAYQAIAGPTSGATPVHTTSLALAEGVLKMMTIKKLTMMAAVILSLATLMVGGGIVLVRTSQAQNEQTKPFAAEERKAQQPKDHVTYIVNPVRDDPQILQMIDLARRRFDMLDARYRQRQVGEISFDALIDASDQLENVELKAARSPAARRVVKEGAHNRLERIEQFAASAAKAGQVTATDVMAVGLRRLQAEFDLKTPDEEKPELPAILRRLKELENKVQELEKRMSASPGRP